jgi:hypothetical protein
MEGLHGWDSLESCASELWGTGDWDILRGEFVFAYSGSGDIRRLVVTKRTDLPETWMVSEVTPGWTMYLPRVPKEYIETVVPQEMTLKKLDKEIIKDYKNCIKNG